MIKFKQIQLIGLLLAAHLFFPSPFLADTREVIHSVQFRTYSFDGTHRWYYTPQSNQSAPAVFLNQGFAGHYDYTGPSPLRFHRMEANEEGTEVPVDQAIAILPEEAEQLLLILFPRKPNQSVNPIYVIEESEGRFPAGHVRLFNFCPDPMALHFGDRAHIVAPGRHLTLEPSPVRHQNYRVRVGKKINGDHWDLIKTSLWAMESHQRTLIFLTPDDRHPEAVAVNTLVQNLSHHETSATDSDGERIAPSEILIERKQ